MDQFNNSLNGTCSIVIENLEEQWSSQFHAWAQQEIQHYSGVTAGVVASAAAAVPPPPPPPWAHQSTLHSTTPHMHHYIHSQPSGPAIQHIAAAPPMVHRVNTSPLVSSSVASNALSMPPSLNISSGVSRSYEQPAQYINVPPKDKKVVVVADPKPFDTSLPNVKQGSLWSVDAEITLIDMIREREVLWRPALSVHFKNRHSKELKANALQEIADELNRQFPIFNGRLTTEMVDLKWASLRSYKCRKLEGCRNSYFQRKEWIHSKRLDFLKGLYVYSDRPMGSQPVEATDSLGAISLTVGQQRQCQDTCSPQDNTEKTEIFSPWNHETEAILIETVRQYPILYNEKLPQFKRKKLRVLAISKVTNFLNSEVPLFKDHPLSIEDVQEKWSRLRTHFLGNVRHANRPRVRKKRKDWVHLDRLQFILPHNLPSPVSYPQDRTESSASSAVVEAADNTASDPCDDAVKISRKKNYKIHRKWSFNMERKLILAIKKHPELWDPNVTPYKRSMIFLTFDIIAHELNSTVREFKKNPLNPLEAQRKWSTLRTIRRQKDALEDREHASLWKHYHATSFIAPDSGHRCVEEDDDIYNPVDVDDSDVEADILGRDACEENTSEIDPQTKLLTGLKLKKVALPSTAVSGNLDDCHGNQDNDHDDGSYWADLTRYDQGDECVDVDTFKPWDESDDVTGKIPILANPRRLHKTAPMRKWSFKDTLYLILSVEDFPCLWNPYKPSNQKNMRRCLSHISAFLNSTLFANNSATKDEILVRWLKLHKYKTELHRLSHSDSTISKRHPWIYSRHLNFILIDPSQVEEKFLQPDPDTLDKKQRFQRHWTATQLFFLIEIAEHDSAFWTSTSRQERVESLSRVTRHLNLNVAAFRRQPLASQEVTYKFSKLREYKISRHRKLMKRVTEAKDGSEEYLKMDEENWIFSKRLDYVLQWQKVSSDITKSCHSHKNDMRLDGKKTVRHWSTKQIVQLIRLVREHPELWQNENCSILEKYRSWDIVVKRLNASVPEFVQRPLRSREAQSKFNVLRSYYFRLGKTLMKQRSFVSLQRWPYFRHLTFLDNTNDEDNKSEHCTDSSCYQTNENSESAEDDDTVPEYIDIGRGGLGSKWRPWSKKQIFKLISEIRKCPPLYRGNQRLAKFRCWGDVVRNLNACDLFKHDAVNRQDVKTKYNHLRMYKRRMILRESKGKTCEWIFSKPLDFLFDNDGDCDHNFEENTEEDNDCEKELDYVKVKQEHDDEVESGLDDDNSDIECHWRSKRLQWLHSSVLKLINAVSKFPELWDQNLSVSAKLKYALFDKIAEHLNMNVRQFRKLPINGMDVLKKFKELRASKLQQKQLEKLGESATSGLFDSHMEFVLLPSSLTARQRDQNIRNVDALLGLLSTDFMSRRPTESIECQPDVVLEPCYDSNSGYDDASAGSTLAKNPTGPSVSSVRWSHETILSLIREVKLRPEMWDERLGASRKDRDAALLDVVSALTTKHGALCFGAPLTPLHVSRKFNSLRCHKFKLMKNKNSSAAKKWAFSEEMDFISKPVKNEVRSSKLFHGDENTSAYEEAAEYDKGSREGSQTPTSVLSKDLSDIATHYWDSTRTMSLISAVKRHPLLWGSSLPCIIFDCSDTASGVADDGVPQKQYENTPAKDEVVCTELSACAGDELSRSTACSLLKVEEVLEDQHDIGLESSVFSKSFTSSETFSDSAEVANTGDKLPVLNGSDISASCNDLDDTNSPNESKSEIRHSCLQNITSHLNRTMEFFKDKPLSVSDVSVKWSSLLHKTMVHTRRQSSGLLADWEFAEHLSFVLNPNAFSIDEQNKKMENTVVTSGDALQAQKRNSLDSELSLPLTKRKRIESPHNDSEVTIINSLDVSSSDNLLDSNAALVVPDHNRVTNPAAFGDNQRPTDEVLAVVDMDMNDEFSGSVGDAPQCNEGVILNNNDSGNHSSKSDGRTAANTEANSSQSPAARKICKLALDSVKLAFQNESNVDINDCTALFAQIAKVCANYVNKNVQK